MGEGTGPPEGSIWDVWGLGAERAGPSPTWLCCVSRGGEQKGRSQPEQPAAS